MLLVYCQYLLFRNSSLALISLGKCLSMHQIFVQKVSRSTLDPQKTYPFSTKRRNYPAYPAHVGDKWATLHSEGCSFVSLKIKDHSAASVVNVSFDLHLRYDFQLASFLLSLRISTVFSFFFVCLTFPCFKSNFLPHSDKTFADFNFHLLLRPDTFYSFHCVTRYCVPQHAAIEFDAKMRTGN